eukprot:13653170-Ditylum_brightwellii.AAC.1
MRRQRQRAIVASHSQCGGGKLRPLGQNELPRIPGIGHKYAVGPTKESSCLHGDLVGEHRRGIPRHEHP